MLDEFEKIKGYHEPGFITGKPIELGGIKIRGDATSKGGLIVLKKFLEKMNIDKKNIIKDFLNYIIRNHSKYLNSKLFLAA